MKTPSLFRVALAVALPLCTLFWLAIVPPAVAADVTAGLKLRFSFDSAPVNNVVADTSPAGTHPGTNYLATWQANENGRAGVMDFIAPIPNSISVPAIPALNSTQGTISFWMKSSTPQLRGNFAAILFDRRDADGDVITLTDVGTIFIQALSGYNHVNSFSGTQIINDDAWHHIAYVYDQSASGSITVYVDGVQDATNPNTQAWAWPPAPRPILLGASPDSYWRPFVGSMDDFQITRRTR